MQQSGPGVGNYGPIVTMISLPALLGIIVSLALVGCGDSSDGSGGSGGGTVMPRLRFAHLAAEIPSAANTAVDLLVDGETRAQEVLFGQAEPFFSLSPGEHQIGLALPGSTESLFSFPLLVQDGDVITAVAYRVNEADPPLDVFLLDGSLDGLEPGNGRVVVAHGVDEAILSAVNVIVDAEGACPPALVSDLEFGEQATLDVQATTFPLAFSAAPTDQVCSPVFDPLEATVAPDVATLWIAVDRDTREEFLNPSVYALAGDASGEIPDLDPVSP